MKLTNIPFTVTDWSAIEPTEQEPPIGERSIFMTCGFDLSNTPRVTLLIIGATKDIFCSCWKAFWKRNLWTAVHLL